MIGTRSADYIKASGYERRTNRPDTWLAPDRKQKAKRIPWPVGAVHTWPNADVLRCCMN